VTSTGAQGTTFTLTLPGEETIRAV
jgi:hypothetical protein